MIGEAGVRQSERDGALKSKGNIDRAKKKYYAYFGLD